MFLLYSFLLEKNDGAWQNVKKKTITGPSVCLTLITI